MPDEDEMPARLSSVLAVIYPIFNEGYTATSDEDLLRRSLSTEAIQLARLKQAGNKVERKYLSRRLDEVSAP